MPLECCNWITSLSHRMDLLVFPNIDKRSMKSRISQGRAKNQNLQILKNLSTTLNEHSKSAIFLLQIDTWMWKKKYILLFVVDHLLLNAVQCIHYQINIFPLFPTLINKLMVSAIQETYEKASQGSHHITSSASNENPFISHSTPSFNVKLIKWQTKYNWKRHI